MMTLLRVLVTAVALIGLGALSRVPFRTRTDDNAVLRFSWRERANAEQHCRKRTEEELALLPVHMRTPEVCTGRMAKYRLAITVDGQQLAPLDLHAAGAHADRPIFVLHDVPLAPGRHAIAAEFYNTMHPHKHRRHFQDVVSVGSGEILLISYDDERETLVLTREPK